MKDLAYNLGGFLHLLTWKDYVIMLLVFLILVLLLVIYYLVKVKEEGSEIKESVSNKKIDFDLKSIKENLDREEPKAIKLTAYEEEQEDKAIISYQELLNKSKNISFADYDDEYQNFEVKIKKINLDELSKPKEKESDQVVKEPPKVQMMSYEKENDFLDALKKLQNKLSK